MKEWQRLTVPQGEGKGKESKQGRGEEQPKRQNDKKNERKENRDPKMGRRTLARNS